MTDQEQQFVDYIVGQLNQSIAELDPAVNARLTQLRQQAVSLASARADTPKRSIGQAGLWQPNLDPLATNNEAVPAQIETRLNEIRRQALAKAVRLQQSGAREPGSSKLVTRYWFNLLEGLKTRSTAAFASAAVAVIAVSLLVVLPQTENEVTINEEINLLASADDLELYENLDFYLWLAENGLSN